LEQGHDPDHDQRRGARRGVARRDVQMIDAVPTADIENLKKDPELRIAARARTA